MNALHNDNTLKFCEWHGKQTMLLPSGARLVLLGHNREMMANYQYRRYQGLVFEFWAMKWDEELNPRDYWEVFLGFALESAAAKKAELTLDDVREIAKDIEDALLAWPAGKVSAQVPIKEVRFLMTPWALWSSQQDPYLDRQSLT